MCLRKITRTTNLKQEGIGWKIFRKEYSNIFPMFYYDYDNAIRTGKWINEKEYRVPGISPPKEGFGFQIFLRRKDVIHWANLSGNKEEVRRVRWRKPVARGLYSALLFKTIVAKEIFVEEEPCV